MQELGMQECRNVGIQECRNVEMQECMIVRMQECKNIGMYECMTKSDEVTLESQLHMQAKFYPGDKWTEGIKDQLDSCDSESSPSGRNMFIFQTMLLGSINLNTEIHCEVFQRAQVPKGLQVFKWGMGRTEVVTTLNSSTIIKLTFLSAIL